MRNPYWLIVVGLASCARPGPAALRCTLEVWVPPWRRGFDAAAAPDTTTPHTVTITSPRPFPVFVDDVGRGAVGTTPWTATLHGDHVVIVRARGYQSAIHPIDATTPAQIAFHDVLAFDGDGAPPQLVVTTAVPIDVAIAGHGFAVTPAASQRVFTEPGPTTAVITAADGRRCERSFDGATFATLDVR